MLAVAEALLIQPTAPFHEDAVRAEIEAQLRKCPNVKFARDSFGNVVARYQRGKATGSRWAFAAHMDHPGWLLQDGEWRFFGSVAEPFLADPQTKSFGDFAMWNLPSFEIRDRTIYSRACDDLIGCAEIVCLFHELEAANAPADCFGLFTRAEEVGFVGAIQLARSKNIPARATILSLETSAPRGSAEIGAGPIVRVGDKVSTFDGAATNWLLEVARAAEIPVQRCLLDGGTCEATAYQLYGYTCAAASIPLGNYHNCTPEETIGPEYVAIDDFVGMIRLCVEVVRSRESVSSGPKQLRKKLEANAQSYRAFFPPDGSA